MCVYARETWGAVGRLAAPMSARHSQMAALAQLKPVKSRHVGLQTEPVQQWIKERQMTFKQLSH